MTTALAVVGVLSAIGGAVQQGKVARAQRRQNKINNKVAAIKRQRDIKRSIAASRIQTAQQQSAGFQLGVSGGTAVQGATAGVISDTASAIGQSNLQFTGQQFVSGLQDSISRAQQTQANFGALGSISNSLVNNPKAVAALENLVS